MIAHAKGCPICGRSPSIKLRVGVHTRKTPTGIWDVWCNAKDCPADQVATSGGTLEAAVVRWNLRAVCGSLLTVEVDES